MTPYMILNNLNDWHLEPKHQKTKCFQGGGGGGGGGKKGKIDSKRVNDFVTYFTAFKKSVEGLCRAISLS